GLYGYGRSQGNNRAIVARLRSVHASLARLDHDYQGHRVRAMNAIAMAIRQLTHQSIARDVGFGQGTNNNMGVPLRHGALGAGARQPQALTQAESDARMSRNLRTLYGIGTQLSNQGYGTARHARALVHVQQAVRELNTALAIR